MCWRVLFARELISTPGPVQENGPGENRWLNSEQWAAGHLCPSPLCLNITTWLWPPSTITYTARSAREQLGKSARSHTLSSSISPQWRIWLGENEGGRERGEREGEQRTGWGGKERPEKWDGRVEEMEGGLTLINVAAELQTKFNPLQNHFQVKRNFIYLWGSLLRTTKSIFFITT